MTSNMISAEFAIDRTPIGRSYVTEFVPQPEKCTANKDVNKDTSECSDNSESHPLLSAMKKIHLDDTSSKSEYWQVRKQKGCEEELYVSGKSVVWGRFSPVEDKFPLAYSVDTPVIAACWAQFLLPTRQFTGGDHISVFDNPPGRRQEGVGIFEIDRFTFATEKGEQFTARMPCQLSAVWPITNGILIERKAGEEDRFIGGGRNPLFSMFTITHPLDEITPVIMKVPGPDNEWKISFMTDINQRVVFVSLKPPLVITCDVNTNQHSVWRFNKALPHEYCDLYTIAAGGQASVAPHALSHNTTTATTGSVKTPFKLGVDPVVHARCLSPFAASLTRLTNTPKGKIKPGADTKQEGLQKIPGLDPDPSSPVHLSERIGRLHSFGGVGVHPLKGTLAGHANNMSGSFLFGLTGGRLGTVEQSSCGSNAATAGTPNGRATTSHISAQHHLHGQSHQAVYNSMLTGLDGEPLEEPLLPKACLELLWTECPALQTGCAQPNTPRPTGPEQLPRGIHSSTPMQSQGGPKTCIPPLQATPTTAPTETQHPHWSSMMEGRPRGFVAEDFSGTKFICFLMPRSAQLGCLRVDASNEDHLIFGAVTVLPARDAVYLPDLKLIVVVEPGGTFGLYTGIKKVCKLGTTPPPMINQSSCFGMKDILERLSTPVSLPLTVMATDWREESNLALVGGLRCTPSTSRGIPAFAKGGMVGTLSPVPTKTSSVPAKKHMDDNQRHNENGQQNELFTDTRRFSLKEPCDRSFSVETGEGRLIRIYLPAMADTHLVKRCLTALQKVLPREIGIQLLSRWYVVHNAPGKAEALSEWVKFSGFLLALCGFQSTADSTPYEDVEPVPPSTPTAKRIRAQSPPSDADWDYLLQSVEGTDVPGCGTRETPSSRLTGRLEEVKDCIKPDAAGTILLRNLPAVLLALHLVYEDEKLNKLSWDELDNLALLNGSIARSLGLTEYVYYYAKDFHDIIESVKSSPPIAVDGVTWPSYMPRDTVPSLCDWINGFLENRSPLPAYPHLPGVNERARQILTAFLVMGHTGGAQTPIAMEKYLVLVVSPGRRAVPLVSNVPPECLSSPHLFHRLVLYLSHVGITQDLLDRLPGGLAMTFRLALAECRSNPPPNCSPTVYALLGREDLARQIRIMAPTSGGKGLRQRPAQRWAECVEPLRDLPPQSVKLQKGEDVKHPLLAMLEADPAVQLAFKDDLRIREAYRLVQSTSRVKLRPAPRPEATEQERTEDLESQLLAASVRTMSLPVGRGCLGLDLLTDNVPAKLVVPKLCLNGKAANGRNQFVDLARMDTPANMRVWPEFHNGVAAGLMVSSQAPVDSTWILYNCRAKTASELNPERAGVLLALGLNGHLNKISQANIREYMVKIHDLSNMAILMGLCAGKRGSMDQSITRLLAVHLKPLLPPCPGDLEVPNLGEAGALIGLGLLYQGSAHRHMAELVLKEMGKPPGGDMESNLDRELLALTAGFALGLIMLKKGESHCGVGDLNMSEQLRAYMVGGHRPSGSRRDPWASTVDGKLLLGGDGPRTGPVLHGVDAGDRLADISNPQIREGDRYNVDVTAPGATVALGLMYMGTGNEAVASWLRVPESQYLLDYVRPDLLALRMVALGLVMWDKIEANEAWIASHLPPDIVKYAFKKKQFMEDPEAAEVDFETMSLAYLNVLSGCCFVLGLRYAGTNDPGAASTLRKVAGKLLQACSDSSNLDEVGKVQMESSVALVLLSLSMVMAGSGNLEVLQLVRRLRARIGPQIMYSVNYGCHMMYGLTTGLLFLGGGKLTLSNTPEAAAVLVISLFPRFPAFSSDNRYHLQALRHLYVLATERRRLCPVDAESNRVVSSDLRAVLEDNKGTLLSNTSFILPSGAFDNLQMFEANYKSKDFWPHQFKPGSQEWSVLRRSLREGGYIFVKRKDDSGDYPNSNWRRYHLDRWLSGRHLWQLKLLVTFIRRTQGPNIPPFVQEIVDQVLQKFTQNKQELRQSLLEYYTGSGALSSPIAVAFLVWFSLPSREVLAPAFSQGDLSIFSFMKTAVEVYNLNVDAVFWLQKFLS